LPGCELLAHRFHPLAKCRDLRPAVRCRVNQLLDIDGISRSENLPDVGEQRLDLHEDAEVLAVGAGEQVQADGTAVHERCRHLPIAHDHAQMRAVVTHERFTEVSHGLRIELAKIPVARFAHFRFAA
jgi:ATP-dependent exoDNAse (exonuclease V) beta subunit